jgi:hypothetical protein
MISKAQAMGISLNVVDIFRHPKLRNMAEVVAYSKASHKDIDIEPFALIPDSSIRLKSLLYEAVAQCNVQPEQIEDIYPCTPLQEGLMSISVRQQGAYLSQMVYRIPATLAIDRFKEAWDKVIEAHPILRTRIINSESGGCYQVVLRERIPWQSAASLDEYLDADMKMAIIHGDSLNRLAITSDSLGDRHFIWTAHHAVYDGYSVGLLFDQLTRYYEQQILPDASPFNHFIDFLTHTDIKASHSFWQNQLKGQPASFPQQPSSNYQPRPDQLQRYSIQVLPNDGSDITQSTILRAAFAMLIARYSDSSDIVFGATLSGRDADVAGIAQMLGPTLTTVPVRVRLNHDQSIGDYLQTMQDQATEMIPFAHTGLQNIGRLDGIAKEVVDLNNLIVIQPAGQDSSKSNFLGLESVPVDLEDFQTYSLVLECSLDTGGINIEARFDKAVLQASQIQRMLEQLGHIVQQLNGAPPTMP